MESKTVPLTDASCRNQREDKLSELLSFALNAVPNDLACTKPYKVSYFGRDYEVSSWKDLLREICLLLNAGFPHRFSALRDKVFLPFTRRICLKSSPSDMVEPLKIAQGLWVESNFEAKRIVNFVVTLVQYCELDSAKVRVHYRTRILQQKRKMHKPSGTADQEISFTNWNCFALSITISSELESKNELPKNSPLALPSHHESNHRVILAESTANLPLDEVSERISSEGSRIFRILSEFHNGFRPDSPIDQNRFQRSWRERYGTALSREADSQIRPVCQAYCANLNGTFYAITEAMKDAVKNAIELELNKGVRIFFFSEFYDRNASIFLAKGIVNTDLLREIVVREFPGFKCEKLMFRSEESVSVEAELDHVMSKLEIASAETLKANFPLIPHHLIEKILSKNPQKYVRNKRDEYAYLPHLSFDDADIANALHLIEADLEVNGFSTIRKFDVTRTLALNTGISKTALQTGLFDKFFSDRYMRTHSIVTAKGDPLNAAKIFAHFCFSHKFFTLDELNQLETEVTGLHNNHALAVALNACVRLDRNHFSPLDYVRFDAEAADLALDITLGGQAATLLSIRDFSFLPQLENTAWNHYLLESFVRHFSRNWHVATPAPNSARIGILYPQAESDRNYTDFAVEILRRSDVKNQEDVEKVCLSLGIFARLGKSKSEELARRVMEGID